MVCGNALLRPNIREHSALIEKSSPHRKSSRRITGKSESTPLRFDEVFQQTARADLGEMDSTRATSLVCALPCLRGRDGEGWCEMVNHIACPLPVLPCKRERGRCGTVHRSSTRMVLSPRNAL